jgi:two-component system OmpR family sensor kinase
VNPPIAPARTRSLPTASLFGQLLALIVLSLVGSVAINTLVLVNLPPPMPDFYRTSEIAQTLKGHSNITAAERRPLVTETTATPPLADPPPESRGMQKMREDLAVQLGIDAGRIIVASETPRFTDTRAFRLVRSAMARRGRASDERFMLAPFKVAIPAPNGQWLVVQPKPSLEPTPWQIRIILSVLLSTLALAPLAYLFARRLAAPIALFAAASERLGRDPGAPPLPVGGPAELAVAARAFNDMQERLARYVEDRIAMVGAIAHDLRTPLTRLRFRVESAPEGVRGKMADDIAEMEAMISGALAFVRDATAPAARTRLELSSLLESLADEMHETGLNVGVDHAERVVINGDPIALRRLFNNLLDNAVKYGGDARVRISGLDGEAIVEIDDHGPGLPERELERVFEPFHRHDPSRSRETGGIGLGLAVVRSVARAHGGDAGLSNRPGGGLRARVTLPV